MELRITKLLKVNFLCLIFLPLTPYAAPGQSPLSYAQLKKYAAPQSAYQQRLGYRIFNTFLRADLSTKPKSSTAYPLLPQWTPADLPLFCKIEYHLDKVLPIPVRFRLGSVDYVNWLEQKTGY
jgi:hypothetical protein